MKGGRVEHNEEKWVEGATTTREKGGQRKERAPETLRRRGLACKKKNPLLQTFYTAYPSVLPSLSEAESALDEAARR